MTAEAKGIINDGFYLLLTGSVGHVIEVTFRIGHLIIYSGRDGIGLDGFGANGHLDGAGGAEHVAGSSFGRANAELARMGTENGFDGLGLRDVALRCRSAVS